MRTDTAIPRVTSARGSAANTSARWRRTLTVSLIGASLTVGHAAGPATAAVTGQVATPAVVSGQASPAAPLPVTGAPAPAGASLTAPILVDPLLSAPGLIAPAAGTSSRRPVVVRCPAGGSITVAAWLQKRLTRLLKDSYKAGLRICGTGWRSRTKQIQLRIQNCGKTKRAIYLWPASWCRPVTAKPGSSLHERGLAVDFHSRRSGQTSAMYRWLARNAGRYGLRVERSGTEPWHYSETGR